jgi:pilin isopeptide linkage protein
MKRKLSLSSKIFSIVFFLLLLLVGKTLTWTSVSQSALNMWGIDSKREVHLLKLEKDMNGNETEHPVEGAEFYLFQVTPTGDVQIGGLYSTDAEGKITIDLAPGDYYFLEHRPGEGFDFDVDSNGEAIKKYPFTVTPSSDNSKPIVTVFNRRSAGKLELKKIVENEDGSALTSEQLEEEFEFKVTFSDGNGYYYSIDGGSKTFLNSGGTLKLKHGQTATFDALPVGVYYSIIETPRPGYGTSSTNSSGNISTLPSVSTFVNTFERTGSLEVSKEVINGDGSPLTAEQEQHVFKFVFHIDSEGQYDYSTNKGQTGTLSDGDNFELVHGEHLILKGLPQGAEYTIRELPQDGYTASPSEYTGRVSGGYLVYLPFVNQYNSTTEEGSLSFEKKIITSPIDEDQKFPFVVTFSDNGSYEYSINEGPKQLLQSGGTIELKHGDIVTFPHLPAGLGYTIEEKNVAHYQPSFDKVTGQILSNEHTHYVFENSYAAPSQLIIEKEGKGAGFDSSKIFEFTLWINDVEWPEKIHLRAGESSVPIPVQPGDTWRVEETNNWDDAYAQTAIVNGSGVVSGEGLIIYVTVTNTYVGDALTQIKGKKTWVVPPGQTGLIPDSIEVLLKIGDKVVARQVVTGPDWSYSFDVPKVDDNGNEIHYTIEEVPVEGFYPEQGPGPFDLTNTWISPIEVLPPPVVKIMTGDKPAQEEKFEFVMTPGDVKVHINGAGKVNFDALSFKKAGDYQFTLREVNAHKVGMTYDASVYTWKVSIVQKQGKLRLDSEVLLKNGEHYEGKDFRFTNHYDQSKADEETIIKGKKTWDYGDLPQKERPTSIQVILLGNGKPVYQTEVTAAEAWAYSFKVPRYDEKGKLIVYSIDEKKIPGFSVEKNGYDLKNIYDGKTKVPSSTAPPGERQHLPLPESGVRDRIALLLWGLNLLMLAAILLMKRGTHFPPDKK